MICAANPAQTIHKTLHRNPTFCCLNTNQTDEREWIVRNASNERNERDERNERNERDERNERNERDGAVTGWWRCQRGVTEVSREQSFIISFKSAPFLKH